MAMCSELAESIAARPAFFFVNRASAHPCDEAADPGWALDQQKENGRPRIAAQLDNDKPLGVLSPPAHLARPASTALRPVFRCLAEADEHRRRVSRPPQTHAE